MLAVHATSSDEDDATETFQFPVLAPAQLNSGDGQNLPDDQGLLSQQFIEHMRQQLDKAEMLALQRQQQLKLERSQLNHRPEPRLPGLHGAEDAEADWVAAPSLPSLPEIKEPHVLNVPVTIDWSDHRDESYQTTFEQKSNEYVQVTTAYTWADEEFTVIYLGKIGRATE
jgi:hypothetical protein